MKNLNQLKREYQNYRFKDVISFKNFVKNYKKIKKDVDLKP